LNLQWFVDYMCGFWRIILFASYQGKQSVPFRMAASCNVPAVSESKANNPPPQGAMIQPIDGKDFAGQLTLRRSRQHGLAFRSSFGMVNCQSIRLVDTHPIAVVLQDGNAGAFARRNRQTDCRGQEYQRQEEEKTQHHTTYSINLCSVTLLLSTYVQSLALFLFSLLNYGVAELFHGSRACFLWTFDYLGHSQQTRNPAYVNNNCDVYGTGSLIEPRALNLDESFFSLSGKIDHSY
jgi:hypothetical protein